MKKSAQLIRRLLVPFVVWLAGCCGTATLPGRPSVSGAQGSNAATQGNISAARAALHDSQLKAAKGASHLDNADKNLSKLLAP